MAELSDEPLFDAVGAVEDPVLFHPLAELETLRHISVRGGKATIEISSPLAKYPAQTELRQRLAAALPSELATSFQLVLSPLGEEEVTLLGERLRALDGTSGKEGVNPFSKRGAMTRVISVTSGKGGVGKSTVAVNLAVALAHAGYSVGLLDADIYGFSAPRMLGIDYAPLALGRTIVPPVAHGVRCISMGLFVDDAKALPWRGPMLHKALRQFLVDVHWGSPNFLLVDTPPGTGDIALSLGEQLPHAEVYVVTTPQPAAERTAQRSGALGRQLHLPVRGVIENMSWFAGDDGARYELFGAGGGEMLARSLGVPLLAQIPLSMPVRQGSDEGLPALIAEPAGEVARAFADLAKALIASGPARIYRSELSVS